MHQEECGWGDWRMRIGLRDASLPCTCVILVFVRLKRVTATVSKGKREGGAAAAQPMTID
jgi:hypothetical protein